MLSTVAVGTDGSATASEALEAAIEIAQRFDAKLVLLSAFQDASDASSARDPELQWAVNKNARVREILSRTEQDLRDRKIECTSMIDEGDPAEVLTRLAQECEADLLVIGNKGMHRRVLGSVPNSVTTRRRVRCTSLRRPDSGRPGCAGAEPEARVGRNSGRVRGFWQT